MRTTALLALAFVAGCGSSSPVGTIRFQTQAPVWRVDDKQPLPAAPKERVFYRNFNKADNSVFRRATRAMELRTGKRVLDVNSIDEVPDSTWFTNRIGIRDMSIDELKRGPNLSDSPFDHLPWTITGGKVGGRSLGFTFEDAKKRKFLLKFDLKEFAEIETGAHIISHRILYALGYNVPEDHIGFVRRSDIVIGEKAKKKGIDEAKFDEAMKLVFHREDGQIRVFASMFLPGTPIGPYAREGLRRDDPNDMIPHERRRSIRGQYPIFAWLDHTDLKEDNTLDTFKDGYVTHYLIDFGKSLGAMGTAGLDRSEGFRFAYDIPSAALDLVTFGLRIHGWEDRPQPPFRGIGLYDAVHFSPGAWKSVQPYWPMLDKDRFDAFWGAKLMMRLKPHELAAIVEEAKYSDPRAAKYMVDTLVKRQRITARYWFDRVAPLDQFAVDAAGDKARLCFTDLTLHYMLRESPTSYAINTYDHDGKATRFATNVRAGQQGRTCMEMPLAPRADGYTIVRLRVQRDNREMPPVIVHVARDKAGRLEVVGLRRR